jgi:hypothetical protein
MCIRFNRFPSNRLSITLPTNRSVLKFVVQATASNSDVIGLLDKFDERLEDIEELIFAIESSTLCVPGVVVGDEKEVLRAIKTLDRV